MAKPILHLVCNAHIDPVWIWDWQDGCLNALSTFRHAVDFLAEYPELIFNHNEALLYEWVEQHDPELFAAIQKLVAAKRWNITGGWYLQPDCTMPEGETFVRLALYGRDYFKRKFGVQPVVSYNFDAFTGHHGSIPQILRRSGFEFYIHCRPCSTDVPLPSFFYRWRGIDGSEVYAYRPPSETYCTEIHKAEERLLKCIEKSQGHLGDQMFLWGVGDHGGGPTRLDLDMFRRHMAKDDLPFTLKHSTPELFLQAMKEQNPNPPAHTGEFSKGALGCLTSDAGTKRRHRQLDSLLHKAERYGALAAIRCGKPAQDAQLAEGWRSHMLQTFHDVLPGTSIVPGIESVALLAQEGMAAASKSILASQIALTRDAAVADKDFPLFVFNPHPWQVTAPAVAEFLLDWRAVGRDPRDPLSLLHLEDTDGNRVPVQSERSYQNNDVEWRRRICFTADVPAGGIRRYRVVHDRTRPLDDATVDRMDETETGLRIENDFFILELAKASGYITRLFDRKAGQDALVAPAGVPMVMNDCGDAWIFIENQHREKLGEFRFVDDDTMGELLIGIAGKRASLNVIERGPVRTIIATVLRYGRSSIWQRYTLWHQTPWLDIDMRIAWDERKRLLKLSLPVSGKITGAQAGIAFGEISRPIDGSENQYNRWIRVSREDGYALAVLSQAQHGFDVTAEEIRLSLIRSSIANFGLSGHIIPENRPADFIDLGQHEIGLRILGGRSEDLAARVAHESELFRLPLDGFMSFPTTRREAKVRPAIAGVLDVSNPAVLLSALKRSVDDNAWIIRLVNSQGTKATCEVRFEQLPVLKTVFDPYAVRTWRAENSRLVECDMMERVC